MNDTVNNNNKTILIKKASGQEEWFSVKKLEYSLRNAGAENATIHKIVDHITAWIYPGVTTKQIYTLAFELLDREQNISATLYKLKQAIMELGPSGYPFERFIGQLLEMQGFKTEVGVIIEGNCVSHEVDVVATRNHSQFLVECKFSSDQGKNISVQVPLYVHSRINDIIQKRQFMPQYENISFSGWIVTNTRFSCDSLTYGKCSGRHLIGWDYPEGNGLKDMIEKVKIYPVTILSSLTKKEKQYLIDNNIVICRQLFEQFDIVKSMHMSHKKINSVKKELHTILNII